MSNPNSFMVNEVSSGSDSLVLKIEEYSDGEIDTVLFILYDSKESTYVVYGKRENVFNKLEYVPYSFRSETSEDLADFISFAICKKNKWSYTLYNYDNLPYNCNDITFYYLKNLDGDREYEIAGYDNKHYNRDYLVKALKMLKYVFNYY